MYIYIYIYVRGGCRSRPPAPATMGSPRRFGVPPSPAMMGSPPPPPLWKYARSPRARPPLWKFVWLSRRPPCGNVVSPAAFVDRPVQARTGSTIPAPARTRMRTHDHARTHASTSHHLCLHACMHARTCTHAHCLHACSNVGAKTRYHGPGLEGGTPS